MTLAEEFKKSLKFSEVEEVLDLVLYRPLGFILAKSFSYTPITPNQVTLLSLATGLISAWCLGHGAGSYMVLAGLWYMASNAIDCADGQLARLQQSGTPWGRLVDGVVDWIVGVTVFLSLGLGLSLATGNPLMWLLAAIGGVSSAGHAIVFDYMQQQYLSVVRNQKPYIYRELEKVRATEHGGPKLRDAVLRLYSRYLGLQERWFSAADPSQGESPEVFREHNRRVMRGWSFLGPTTNRTLFAAGCLLQRPDLFLWCVVIVGNAYLLLMILWQARIRRQCAKRALAS